MPFVGLLGIESVLELKLAGDVVVGVGADVVVDVVLDVVLDVLFDVVVNVVLDVRASVNVCPSVRRTEIDIASSRARNSNNDIARVKQLKLTSLLKCLTGN